MKTKYKIIALSIVAGLGAWVADAFIDSQFFHEGTFWGALITETSAHETFMRGVDAIVIMVSGIVVLGVMIRIKDANKELRTSRDLVLRLSMVRHLDEGLRLCLDAAIRASEMDCGGVYLLDEASGGMDLVCHRGLSPDFVRSISRCEAESDNLKLIMSGKPTYAQHQDLDVLLDENERHENLRAIAVVPISKDGRVIGCLNIASHVVDRVQTRSRLALETIAAQIGGAVGRLRAEKALADEKDFADSLIKTTPAIILLLDREGRVKHFNPHMEQISGYRLEEVKGKDWFTTFLPERDRERVRERFAGASSGIQAHGYVNPIVAKDGCEREIEWCDKILEDGNGNLVGVLATGQDITERKRAQDALAESEQKYKTLFESAGDALFTMNFTEDGAHFLDCNEHTLKLFGCTHRDQVIGKTPEYFSPPTQPDGQPSAEKACDIAKAVLEGRPQIFEWMHCRSDGTSFWVEVNLKSMELKGKPRMQAVVRDITERKEAEEELRRSRDFVERILNGMHESVMVLDSELTITDVNRVYLEQNKASLEQVIGNKCYQLNHRQDEPCSCSEDSCPARTVLETGRACQADHLHFDGAGNEHIAEIHAFPLFAEDGTIEHAVQLSHDITLRKQAEQLLRESEQRYRSLYVSMSEGVALHEIIYDESGRAADYRINDVNPAFESILGIRREDAVGAKASEIYGTGEAPYLEIYAKVAGSSEPVSFETTFEPMGKSLRIVAFSPGEGRFATLFADTTRRNRLEEREREHQAQLTHVSRLTLAGELASGIAHELNQPLAAIATSSEACKRFIDSGGADSPEVHDALVQISAQAQRGGEIIRRMRNFVSKRELAFSTADLNDVAHEAIRLVQASARQSGIWLQLDLAEGPLTVFADKVQIQQVIINLVQNGLDSMRETESSERRLTVRTARSDQNKVEVAVVDTGEGLPDENIEKVFEPFFTTKPEGLGIGLSISRSIVEAHKGRIWGRSNPDRGMAFGFALPSE